MSLTINAKTFANDSYTQNAVYYIGPAKTASVKDDLRLARTAAKPTSTFSGVARANTKLVRTLTLTGALTPTGEIIANVELSVPIGAASADVDTFCTDLGSWISAANFKLFAKNSQINF